MTDGQWNALCEFRVQMRALCDTWGQITDALYPLQTEAAKKDTPPYPLETAVVYNSDYDRIARDDQVRLIVVGDNPGKEEQLAQNRRYLVGQSGRIADGFFRRNPAFGIDFRRNVLIANKTPVHTAKTAHLRFLLRNGDCLVRDAIMQSQVQMARLTARLHQSLVMGTEAGQPVPQLWLVGYAELKPRGIFEPYRDALLDAYRAKSGTLVDAWQQVLVYQHFSMNRFLVDLSRRLKDTGQTDTVAAARALGTDHRVEIFGC